MNKSYRTWTYSEEKFHGRGKDPLPTWRNEAGYRVIEDHLGSRLYGRSERKWVIVKPNGSILRGNSWRTSHKPRRFSTSESAKRKVEKFGKQWEQWDHNREVRRRADPFRMAANKAERALNHLKELDAEYGLGINEDAYTKLEAEIATNERAAKEIEADKVDVETP